MTHPVEAWALANQGLAVWIAGIGTVGALAAAVYTADNASRRDRRRGAAILRANVTMVDAAVNLLVHARPEYEPQDYDARADVAVSLLRTDCLQKTSQTAHGTGLGEMADPDAVTALLHARTMTDSAISMLQDVAGQSLVWEVAVYDRHIAGLREAVALFDKAWMRQLTLLERARWALNKPARS